MEVKIFDHIDKKGMGTTDLFNIIPTGKKGDSFSFPVEHGTVTFDFHSNIRDAEMKVAITLLSHTFNQLGKKNIDKFRDGSFSLPEIDSETGQTIYTDGITIDAKNLSEIINKGDRTKGRRLFKNLQHLEDLTIRYNLSYLQSTTRLFDNVAYKNGKITFNIANTLLNRLKESFRAFRLQPVLAHNGLTMRLAMFVETRQRPGKKYTDSSGEKRRKFYPLNTYNLDDIVASLRLGDQREDRMIESLQIAFDELKAENDSFPQFKYRKNRRWFESEYLNGTVKKLTK